jgi:hypothetical protein
MMILEGASLSDTHHVPLALAENTPSVCLLQVEAQDSLLDIVEFMCRQQKPVFLLLPADGELFNAAEHFVSLRHMLAERSWSCFLCLIIPPERIHVLTLAAHFAVQSAPSLEEAFQKFMQAQQVTQRDAPQMTEPVRKATIAGRPKRLGVLHPSGKQHVILGIGLLAALLVASVHSRARCWTPRRPGS